MGKKCRIDLMFDSLVYHLLFVMGQRFPSSPSGLRRASRVQGSGFNTRFQVSGFRFQESLEA
jgi:hypothetical protein